MSVAMTNAGALGWVSDRGGYRYDPLDPLSGQHWPVMPPVFAQLAGRAAARAGFAGFTPDACLVNRYEASAGLSLHQDRDEAALDAPVLSVSLGDAALFRIGGGDRKGPTRSLRLESGDVLLLGGASRLAYHGIDRIYPGSSPLLKDGGRINLTLRRVNPAP